jgi:hypothetical protein
LELDYTSSVYTSILGVVDVVSDITSDASSLLDLVSSYGNVVGSQLVEGQDQVDVLYTNFRASIASITGSTGASNVSMTLPLTTLEAYVGVNAPTTTYPVYASADSFYVSAISFNALVFGGNNFSSNPLRIEVSDTTMLASDVVFTVINNFNETYEITEYNYVLNTTCEAYEVSETNYTCPVSGVVLSHQCTNLPYSYNEVTTCPDTVYMPVCNLLDVSSSSTTADGGVSCTVLEYTSMNVTCSCAISRRRILTPQRHLSSSAGSIDTAAITQYSIDTFLDTSSHQGGVITTDDASGAYVILLLFGSIWSIGVLLLMVSLNQKAVESKEMKKVQPVSDVSTATATVGKRKLATGNIHAKRDSTQEAIAELKEYLTNYIRELFPNVFIQETGLKKLAAEIVRNHLYLRPFGRDTDVTAKAVGITRIVTTQTFLVFSLCLLYSLQSPVDNGVCAEQSSSEDCLSKKSLFDSTVSACEWQHNTSYDSYQCVYQEVQVSYVMLLYFAVLISGVNCGIGWLFDQIFAGISAPLNSRGGAKVQPEVSADLMQSNLKNLIRQDSLQTVKQAMRTRKVVNRVGSVDNEVVIAGRKNMRRNVGESVFTVSGQGLDAYKRIMKRIEVLRGISSSLEMHKERMKVNHLHQIIERTGGSRKSDVDDEVKSDYSDENEVASEKMSDLRQPTLLSLTLSGKSFRAIAPVSPPVLLRSQKNIRNTYEELRFEELRDNITVQRSMLEGEDLHAFDEIWSLDGDGLVTEQAEKRMKQVIKNVHAESTNYLEDLRFMTEPSHIGVRLIHLFVCDLLGKNTPAFHIFKQKSLNYFAHNRVTTLTWKVSLVVLLVCMNAFMFYYSVQAGVTRGLQWQLTLLYGCIFQLILEIIFNESLECVWMHYIIPCMVKPEIRDAFDVITASVEGFWSFNAGKMKNVYLDATAFFFVSKKVAASYSNLPESIIINHYQSYLPGYVGKLWRRRSRASMSFGKVVWKCLVQLGQLPLTIQRIFIRVTQPILFVTFLLLFSKFSEEPWIIALAVVAFILLYGHILVLNLRQLDVFVPAVNRRRRNGIIDIESQKKLRGLAIADMASSSSSSTDEGESGVSVFTPSKRSESPESLKVGLEKGYTPQEKQQLNEFYRENFEAKYDSSDDEDHDPHNTRQTGMDQYQTTQVDADSLSLSTSSNEPTVSSDSSSSDSSSSEEPETEESRSESDSSSDSDSTRSSN